MSDVQLATALGGRRSDETTPYVMDPLKFLLLLVYKSLCSPENPRLNLTDPRR